MSDPVGNAEDRFSRVAAQFLVARSTRCFAKNCKDSNKANISSITACLEGLNIKLPSNNFETK